MYNFGEYEECCLLISCFHSYALSDNADCILVVKATIFTSDQYKSNVLHLSPPRIKIPITVLITLLTYLTNWRLFFHRVLVECNTLMPVLKQLLLTDISAIYHYDSHKHSLTFKW